jgi:hypothetical protein
MTGIEEEQNNLSAEVIAQIRKEATSQAAKYAVIAFIALAGIAASGWWFYLETKIDQYITKRVAGVPSSAVVAFDSPNGCPDGWDYFDRGVSRVIVGAYPPGANAPRDPPLDKNRQPLTKRFYQSDSGQESHTLRLEELPPHDHGIEFATREDYIKGTIVVWAEGGSQNVKTEMTPGVTILGRDTNKGVLGPNTRFTEAAGAGQAFEIMPPHIALFLCRKK